MWFCEHPPAKKRETKKGSRKQAASVSRSHSRKVSRSWAELQIHLSAAAVETSRTWQAYQDLKAQFDELNENFQKREEQLAEAGQDADEMVDLVWQSEERIAAC